MKPFDHRTSDQLSGRTILASVNPAGDDVVIVVSGGDRPHVGCVVLAQSIASPRDASRLEVTCSVLTIPPHKEESVARPIAEAVCRSSGRVVVVTAGIHEDHLDAEGVRIYVNLAEQMAAELAERLR